MTMPAGSVYGIPVEKDIAYNMLKNKKIEISKKQHDIISLVDDQR